jgi:antitoxin ParD1/3/4
LNAGIRMIEVSNPPHRAGLAGLRLVEEREAKLKALRTMLEASIAAGGEAGDAEIDEALAAKAAQLKKEGF